MDTTYKVSESRQTFAPIRLGLRLFGNCRAALLEWHERKETRARLFGLSDRELHDIGVSPGEIDYVASNRDIDPRGIRSAG